MAGVIEDADPEPGGFSVSEATVTAAPTVTRLEFDVEVLQDRLRLMGIGPDVVEEAGRRLREDPRAGYRWVVDRLRRLEPPRRPHACNCGEALVELDWRGRATVRCRRCGSRWGVEVRDDRESVWLISGPSDEWQRVQLAEDELPDDDNAPDDVLVRGLPPMPVALEPGQGCPLASWSDDRFGAVLYVYRLDPRDDGFALDEYEAEIEYLRRDSDGGWIAVGAGGGDWINPFDAPEDLLQKYVVFSTNTSGTSGGGVAVHFVGGLCRADVAFVEIHDSHGTTVARHS